MRNSDGDPILDGTILRVDDLVASYTVEAHRKVQAVAGVTFTIGRGETLGLVGETGCGKTTLAKTIMKLTPSTSGRVVLSGHDLMTMRSSKVKRLRPKFQMVFQNPATSLNPRRRVREIVAEGLSINRVPKPWEGRIDQALSAVGLDPTDVAGRPPRELSGGQCQRVALARALILRPVLLVCDEAVSALDVTIQAQILNLLEDMKEQLSLSMLFISHDLSVVKNISDRVAVMYLGKLCEIAPSDDLYDEPQHPYSQGLIRAIPVPDPFAVASPMLISGDLPSPLSPPSGCRFRTRCPRAEERCAREEPALLPIGERHFVACHFPGAGKSVNGPST